MPDHGGGPAYGRSGEPSHSTNRGRSFADLPNPLTPLLRIWLTGFAFDRITDGTIMMCAAPFSAS